MQSERWFLFMFILSGIWQDMGYGSILYIATLSTVDPCLHEAGHHRWRPPRPADPGTSICHA